MSQGSIKRNDKYEKNPQLLSLKCLQKCEKKLYLVVCWLYKINTKISN